MRPMSTTHKSEQFYTDARRTWPSLVPLDASRPRRPAAFLCEGRRRSVMSALGQKQTCAAHKPMSAKCQKRTSLANKKPRLRLPGYLASQVPRGRQFEYAPEGPRAQLRG